MNKPAAKHLSKFTYADVVQMERAADLLRIEHAPEPAPVDIAPSGASTVLAGYPDGASSDSKATGAIGASTSKFERPNLEQLNARLPRHFVEQVKLFAFMRRMPVAQLIQTALEEYIARASTVIGASTASTTSTLLIDDKTDDDIINLYEKLTAKKSTAADRLTLTELRQKHQPDHIRVGILLSVLRANKKINSLRYCTGAIAEAASLSPQQAENYLGYLRRKTQRT